jgi:hypothetical protein
MGIFTDFYAADPGEVRELFAWVSPPAVGDEPVYDDDPDGFSEAYEEWREQQHHPEPNAEQKARLSELELLDYKGVLPGLVSTLEHLLLGTPIDVGGKMLMLAPGASHTLFQVSSELVGAIAALPEAEFLPLAERWGKHEQVRWSKADAHEFISLFAKLARHAVSRRHGVYLLVSGI